MKNSIALVLVLAVIFALSSPVYAATPPTIQPQYTNVQDATLALSISNSGLATVKMTVLGKSSLTKTDVILYLEKKVGSTWTRVDIGTTGDVWEYSTTSRTFIKSYTHQLSSGGQYRAVAEFTFTATTVEEVTKTATATY